MIRKKNVCSIYSFFQWHPWATRSATSARSIGIDNLRRPMHELLAVSLSTLKIIILSMCNGSLVTLIVWLVIEANSLIKTTKRAAILYLMLLFPTEIHNFLTALFFFQSWSFVLMPWSFVMMYISNIAMWCGFAITWRGSVLALCEVVVIIRGFMVMCCVLCIAWCVYVFVVRFFHYVVIKWRDKDSLLGGPYCKLLGNQ